MSPLWTNIFRKTEEDTLAWFLGNVPVFAELKGRELAFLESMAHIRRYNAGEIVFEEGDPGSGMYLIRSGSVQIFNRPGHGSEEDLAQLGPGDFFGETTLMAPASRTASARTMEKTELIGLFRADLMETAQKHPLIAYKILLGITRIVSERLQAAGLEIRRLRTALETSAAPTVGSSKSSVTSLSGSVRSKVFPAED